MIKIEFTDIHEFLNEIRNGSPPVCVRIECRKVNIETLPQLERNEIIVSYVNEQDQIVYFFNKGKAYWPGDQDDKKGRAEYLRRIENEIKVLCSMQDIEVRGGVFVEDSHD